MPLDCLAQLGNMGEPGPGSMQFDVHVVASIGVVVLHLFVTLGHSSTFTCDLLRRNNLGSSKLLVVRGL